MNITHPSHTSREHRHSRDQVTCSGAPQHIWTSNPAVTRPVPFLWTMSCHEMTFTFPTPWSLYQYLKLIPSSLSAAFTVFCTAGPHKRFPVAAATDILKDVLTSYLQEEKYEVEWSQKMTKTLCEVSESQKLLWAAPCEQPSNLFTGHAHRFLPSCQVIRACIKDLLIPRYKIVVLVHIGQLSGQSMQVSSRCLWDASSDTSASYVIKNSSLFGLASVYAVYYEWTPPGAHDYIWSVFYSWKEKKVVQVCSIFFNFFSTQSNHIISRLFRMNK